MLPDSELECDQYTENLMQLYEEQNKRRGLEICTTQASQYWVILKRKEAEGHFVPDFFYTEVPGCRAAIGMLSIKPNGDVVPCPLLDVKAGNVRERSLREIQNSKVFVDLKNRAVKGKCATCKYKDLCGGCRVRAYISYGDYLAEDQVEHKSLEVVRENVFYPESFIWPIVLCINIKEV
jgi:radical SAM protein with 4Fe4S-binding SPASM domain